MAPAPGEKLAPEGQRVSAGRERASILLHAAGALFTLVGAVTELLYVLTLIRAQRLVGWLMRPTLEQEQSRRERRHMAVGIVIGVLVVLVTLFLSCHARADALSARMAGLRCDGWPIAPTCYDTTAALDTTMLARFYGGNFCIQYPEQTPNRILFAAWARHPSCRRIAKVTLEHGWPGHGATQIGDALDALYPPENKRVDLKAPGVKEALLGYIQNLYARRIYTPSGQRLPIPAWSGIHLEVCRGDSALTAAVRELLASTVDITPGWQRWINCGVPEAVPGWSWMLENYPHQGGTTPGDPYGAFRVLLNDGAGDVPLLFVAAQADSAMKLRQYAYGYASAAMFDGALIFEPKEPNDGQEWWNWPLPTYALGKPLSPVFSEFGGWRRDFQRGSAIAEPEYPVNQGSPTYRGRAWIVEAP